MSIGVSLVWMVISLAAASWSIYRFVRWRKDDKLAREEFARRTRKEA